MDFLREVKERLDLPRGEKAQVMAELESHWVEVRDELVAAGMDATLAEQQAGRRLGTPEDVAARLSVVHNSSTWRSALLAAIPFLAAPMLALFTPVYAPPVLYGLILTLVFVGLMLAGSVREFVAGRRPIWLASWLAASLLSVRGLVWHVVGRSVTFSGVVEPDSPALGAIRMSSIVGLTISVMLMAAALWGSRMWRIPALVLGLFSLAAALSVERFPAADVVAVLGGALASAMLGVLFAWKVFASHRYGSAAQASLFLLTYMTTGYGPGFAGSPLFMLITASVGTVAVLCFARAGSSSRKVLVVLALLLINVICRTADQVQYHPHGSVATGLAMFLTMFPFYLLTGSPILAPFLIEYLRRRRGRLTLAH